MQALGKLTTAPNFRLEELRALTLGELQSLLGYDPALTTLSTQNLRTMVGNRLVNVADAAMISEVMAQKREGSFVGCGGYEELAWAKKGQVTYSAKKVELEINGKEIQIANGPIPVPLSTPKREGFDLILTHAVAYHAIDQGRLVTIVPVEDFTRRWTHESSALRPTGLKAFTTVLEAVLSTHAEWNMIKYKAETRSGLSFFLLVGESLNSCPLADYQALHDTFVTRMTNAVVITDGPNGAVIRKKMMRDAKGALVDIVPSSSVKLVPEAESQEFVRGQGRRPLMLVGPLNPRHKFWAPTKIDLKTLDLAISAGAALRSGSRKGLGLLVSADGFSGLQTERVRFMNMLVGLAIPLINKKQMVDIECEVSYLPPLTYTLGLVCPGGDYRFIVRKFTLSQVGDHIDKVLESPRNGAILISLDPTERPTCNAREDREAVFTKNAELRLGRYNRQSKRWVRFCFIASNLCFAEPYHVFSHGGSANLFGILSTEPGLVMSGVDEGKRVDVKLERFTDLQQWMEFVAQTNIRYNGYAMNPVTFYSPVANTLLAPKNAKLSLTDEGTWTWGRVMNQTSVVSHYQPEMFEGDELVSAERDLSSSSSSSSTPPPRPSIPGPTTGNTQPTPSHVAPLVAPPGAPPPPADQKGEEAPAEDLTGEALV